MSLASAALSRPPPAGGVRAYRARHPERTVLYRELVHHLDRFLQVYEERFERSHGRLRRCVERAAQRYLDCGIFAQGAARVHCGECGHDYLVAFSCKQRCLCPSCHQKRELLWAEWAEEELLAEVPHRQVVLTIPKRLRIFFRFDRRLLGELLGCGWRAWRLCLEGSLDASFEPGGVGFVQTAGELLGWHPHVHLLVTDGGFLADGSFRHLLWVDGEALERLWRAEVLRLLVERGKIGQAVVESLLSWRHSGFSVHAGVRVEEKPAARSAGSVHGAVSDRLGSLGVGRRPRGGGGSPAAVSAGRCVVGPRALGRARVSSSCSRSRAGASSAAGAVLGLVFECCTGQASEGRVVGRLRELAGE